MNLKESVQCHDVILRPNYYDGLCESTGSMRVFTSESQKGWEWTLLT